MTLPRSTASRRLKHRRQIDVQVFARDDGLWEVDALLTDIKTRDVPLAGGMRPAGEPIHDMLLRLVVDTAFNIVEAGAETRAMPYPGRCNAYGKAYAGLAGVNLMQGFRRALRDRVGGTLGCTHLTELALVLPTAVVQAFAGDVLDTKGSGSEQPFQIDRCHALRSDGPAVQEFYPRWYRAPSGAEAAVTRSFQSLPVEDRS